MPPGAPGRAMSLASASRSPRSGYTGGTGIQNSAGEVVQLHRHDGARVIQSSNFFNSGSQRRPVRRPGRLVASSASGCAAARRTISAPVEWVRQMMRKTRAATSCRVMPLGYGPLPYWQAAAPQQPRFLRAAAAARERWTELEQRAAQWAKMEPDDGEPLVLLALAHARQPAGSEHDDRAPGSPDRTRPRPRSAPCPASRSPWPRRWPASRLRLAALPAYSARRAERALFMTNHLANQAAGDAALQLPRTAAARTPAFEDKGGRQAEGPPGGSAARRGRVPHRRAAAGACRRWSRPRATRWCCTSSSATSAR